MAHVSGLVAAKLYPSPVPYADVVTSTTHKTLRGPRSGIILAKENEEIEKKLNSAVFPFTGSERGSLQRAIISSQGRGFTDLPTITITTVNGSGAKLIATTIMSRDINVVSNGTENHIVLVDLRSKNITGKDLEKVLGSVNITVNKNSVPNDTASPFITSGIRIGTPAITTRGFGKKEVVQVANWIADIIENIDDQLVHEKVKNEVNSLTSEFPVYRL